MNELIKNKKADLCSLALVDTRSPLPECVDRMLKRTDIQPLCRIFQ